MLPLLKQILDNFNFKVNSAQTPEQNAEEVTRAAALLSAAVAVEPIPFADMVLITPIQMKMVMHIGLIYGFELSPSRIRQLVAELGATFAYGMLARQVMRGVAKIVAPAVGGVLTAPMVYGWTFALGKLAESYFRAQLSGEKFGALERRRLASRAMEQARTLATPQVLSEFAQSLRERVQGKKDTGVQALPPVASSESKDQGESRSAPEPSATGSESEVRR
ncbi:uncharacterized protein (DUF697 family) [Deinobacterium chartae]|uniref:Uncharacterized protein (DUF697 family) n=1 Tax=Deinobacterium chartae TaxID=521158 RepID=A0A841I1Z5_9DEIO|nr:DUF697 domain-containing protein [Deinobacterium chartae]MBB6099283.1 uncharacterized protein (DUF697 family) [Deinobacterium chartae]